MGHSQAEGVGACHLSDWLQVLLCDQGLSIILNIPQSLFDLRRNKDIDSLRAPRNFMSDTSQFRFFQFGVDHKTEIV